MQLLLPTVAAVLAALPSAVASEICFARACTIGTPTGGGPACSYQMWAPGRLPCGANSAEINPQTQDLDDYLPAEFELCGELVTLVDRNTLSYNGQEYGSDGDNNENGDCTYSGWSCGLINFFGESWFPDVPICDDV